VNANRVVAALTPLAAILAGATANWLAEHAPGLDVSAASLEEVYVGGIAAVVAPAVIWLLGWQKHEAREALAAERADAADLALVGMPAAGEIADPTVGEVFDDVGPGDDLDAEIGVADGEELDEDFDEDFDEDSLFEATAPAAPQPLS
jgi:hypothetical protein